MALRLHAFNNGLAIQMSAALIAGAAAGVSVDILLFPLDTLKTRLQAQHGFRAAGGFNRLYAGLSKVLIGSAPNAALFFFTYESCKAKLGTETMSTALVAALCAELAACSVRIPIELLKIRSQAASLTTKARAIKPNELYRGTFITLARDLPFVAIQLPMFEALKALYMQKSGASDASGLPAALCGSVAGAIAGALTTPLDVLKTRVQLANGSTFRAEYNSAVSKNGYKVLLTGIVPRTAWISLGGAIFLGVYENVSKRLKDIL